MNPNIPWYMTTSITLTEVAIGAAFWMVLSSGARRSGLEPAAQRRVRIGSGLFIGAWLGGALLLAPTPAWILAQDPYYITPLIPLFAGLSLAAAALAFWRSASLRRAVSAVPVAALHALQVWRVLGIFFLMLLATGLLPAHFALPAGWGDIFIGVTAPMIAVALARHTPGARALAVTWNAIGLLDLVVAVGMGTGVLASLLSPGIRVHPAATMGMMPMFLVPAFAVPLSAAFHVLALAGLRREARVGSRLTPPLRGEGRRTT